MHIDFDGPIPHSRVYRISSSELEELKLQLKDYLERDWIRPTTSQFSSCVIFAIKPDAYKVRMCTDYRRLNTYTKEIGSLSLIWTIFWTNLVTLDASPL